MKYQTAHEILKKHCAKLDKLTDLLSAFTALGAMEEYANQFRSQPSQVDGLSACDHTNVIKTRIQNIEDVYECGRCNGVEIVIRVDKITTKHLKYYMATDEQLLIALKAEKEELRKEVDGWRKKVVTLNSRVDDLIDLRDHLQLELSKLGKENEQLKGKLNLLLRELKD